MKSFWKIAANDLRLVLRDRAFFLWSLVFPLVFILIFGGIYREQETRPAAALSVLNRDSGPWGAYFVEKLESPGLRIEVVESEPEEYVRLLVVPEDFSLRLEERSAQRLLLTKRPGTSVRAAARAETSIARGITRLMAELVLYGERDPAAFFEQRAPFRELVEVRSRYPEDTVTRIPSGFDHVVPGIMVQFIIMMVLIYGGISVLEDRQRGILIRLLYGPLSRAHLFGGKFLGRLLMGLVQALILIVTGLIFFSLDLGNVFLSGLNVLLFAAVVAGLSILLGSLIGKEDLMIGVSILVANIMAALGGCWWPLEVVPPSIRALGMISPAYWAMDAFHKLIFFGGAAADVMPNFIVLSCFGVLFALAAARWMRLRD